MDNSQGSGSKTGVLFVCLGNICRSPTAEAVFNDVVQKAGVADQFHIDSCGTGGGNPEWYRDGGWSYHEGELNTRNLHLRNTVPAATAGPEVPGDFFVFV